MSKKLPEGWKTVKLGEVAKVDGGYAFKSKEFVENEIPIVRIGNITENGIELDYSICYSKDFSQVDKYCIAKGDILIAMSGATVGKLGMYNTDKIALLNQRVGKFNIKDNTVLNNMFLFYLLKSETIQNQIINMSSGCAQPNISGKQLESIEFNLPTLEDQERIISILERAESAKRKREECLIILDELVKSRFIEMFGTEKTIFNKWENIEVKDVSEVSVGVVIKPSKYYTEESKGIKTFRSLNVGEMFIKDKDWVYFTKEGNEKNKKSILKEGQVLIVRSGYPGNACVVTEDYQGCNAIDVIIATPDNSKINSTYMCAFTNFPHGKNQILEGQAGAGQKHFNVGSYKKLKIAIPPVELQNQFSDFVKQVDKLKFEMEQSLKELQNNFNSLMQSAFKGELK